MVLINLAHPAERKSVVDDVHASARKRIFVSLLVLARESILDPSKPSTNILNHTVAAGHINTYFWDNSMRRVVFVVPVL
jgi:hypothetical protein